MPICKYVLAQTSPNAERIAWLMARPDEERFALLHSHAATRMAQIDALPQEWRRLVHEYGWVAVRKHWRSHRSFKKAQIDLLGTVLDL